MWRVMTKSAISCGVFESTSDSANPSLIPSENRITVSPSASGTERVVGRAGSAPMKPAFGTSVTRDGRFPRSARNRTPPMLPTPSHGIVAAADEIDQRLARVAVERADRGVRRGRGLLAVAEAVHDRDERPLADSLDEAEIAGLGLPGVRQRRERGLDLHMTRRHFFMVTVVPCPTTESTANSSISRFAPGRPAPTPCEVE